VSSTNVISMGREPIEVTLVVAGAVRSRLLPSRC
jgi:hypothetical protein